MTEETRWSLAGFALPVAVERVTYRAYTPLGGELGAADAEALLRERLLLSVRAQSGGTEPQEARFSAEQDGGLLHVSLTAECLEQIGVERLAPAA